MHAGRPALDRISVSLKAEFYGTKYQNEHILTLFLHSFGEYKSVMIDMTQIIKVPTMLHSFFLKDLFFD